MSVERVGARGQLVAHARRAPQPAAAVVAIVLLVVTLAGSPHFQPKWALWLSVAFLGPGLIAGTSLHGRSARQLASTACAVGTISVLAGGLEGHIHSGQSRWPLEVSLMLLGLGLLAGPLAGLARRQTAHLLPQPAAAVASIILLVGTLAGSPNLDPKLPLWMSSVFLGAGLVVAPLLRDRVAQRISYSASAVVALVVVIIALSDLNNFSPRWGLQLTVVLLIAGLVAGLLGQLFARPDTEVLSARVDELSRTRRGALDVQASELRRIERDLHDGAQARLVALSMKLGRAEESYRDDPYTAALLREAREDAAAAIRELRELARGIAPPILSDRGLEAAVGSLAERSGADVRVSGQLARRPSPAAETAAYFVVAESLTNAAKHASGARVEIRIDERGGDLFIDVTDFGPGGADVSGGGLTGLRQRVEALDGALHVTSPAGVGTQVEAVLPCGW